MPKQALKNIAKNADLSIDTVERYWAAAEKDVEKQYGISKDKDAKRYYSLVMSIVKRRAGVDDLDESSSSLKKCSRCGGSQWIIEGVVPSRCPVCCGSVSITDIVDKNAKEYSDKLESGF